MNDYNPSICMTFDDGYDQGWCDAIEAVCKLSEECSFPLSRHVIEIKLLLLRDEDGDPDPISEG